MSVSMSKSAIPERGSRLLRIFAVEGSFLLRIGDISSARIADCGNSRSEQTSIFLTALLFQNMSSKMRQETSDSAILTNLPKTHVRNIFSNSRSNLAASRRIVLALENLS